MRKLLLVVLVLALLSIGLVTIAGAASTPAVDGGGAQAGLQSAGAGFVPAAVDVSSPYSISLSSGHGLCDHGDSADSSASY